MSGLDGEPTSVARSGFGDSTHVGPRAGLTHFWHEAEVSGELLWARKAPDRIDRGEKSHGHDDVDAGDRDEEFGIGMEPRFVRQRLVDAGDPLGDLPEERRLVIEHDSLRGRQLETGEPVVSGVGEEKLSGVATPAPIEHRVDRILRGDRLLTELPAVRDELAVTQVWRVESSTSGRKSSRRSCARMCASPLSVLMRALAIAFS